MTSHQHYLSNFINKYEISFINYNKYWKLIIYIIPNNRSKQWSVNEKGITLQSVFSIDKPEILTHRIITKLYYFL